MLPSYQQKLQQQEDKHKQEQDNDYPDVFWCENCQNLFEKSQEYSHTQKCRKKEKIPQQQQKEQCPFCKLEINLNIYDKHLYDCSTIIDGYDSQNKQKRIEHQIQIQDIQDRHKNIQKQAPKTKSNFKSQLLEEMNNLQIKQSELQQFSQNNRNPFSYDEEEEEFEESKFQENDRIVIGSNKALKERYNKLIQKEREAMKEEQIQREFRKQQKKLEEQIYIQQAIKRDKEKAEQKRKEEQAMYFYEAKNFEKNKTCAICLSNFDTYEKIAVLACLHKYHISCIKNWLKQKKTCPYCKRDIDPM